MIGSYQALDNLRLSYEESVRIMSFPLSKEQNVFFYNDFYLELFLTKYIPESAEKEFYEHYLKPLMQYDDQNNSDLLNTLREFLNNQFNVADTARKLFIHRNTMLYRLGKIEEILSTEVTLPKVSLPFKSHLSF